MRLGSRATGETSMPAAVGGVRWTVLTYAVGKVITLAATVVLARLLLPADFGVVMLAFVAMNVIGLFGDLGLGATLVLRQDLDRRGLGTALSLLLGAGTVLAILLAAAAPVLSSALHEPRLRGVLTALAPMTVLGSVTWFYQWLLQRELEFRSRFFGFLAQTSVYAVVSIAAAAAGAGIWSIVAGHLAGQAAMAVVFVTLASPVRPRFDPVVARSLLRSSRPFLLQNAVMLIQSNADYVAVGRMLGSAPLGFYSMAFRLSELPNLAVADPVTKVTFPAFSRMRARGEDVRDHYLATLRLVALVTAPWGALLSATAGPLTRLVYGPRWVPMITTLAVLAVWGSLKAVQATVEWFLNSVGGASEAGVIAAVVLALQIPALFLAAARFGLAAVGGVLAAGVTLSLVALVVAIDRRAELGPAAHLAALWPVGAAATGAWLAARATAAVLPSPPAVACLAPLAAGSAVYLAVISVLAPGSVASVMRQVRRVARGVPATTALA